MTENNTFSDISFDTIGFQSCWKSERSSENAASQTVECTYSEQGSQYISSSSAEVQTDAELAVVGTSSEVDYNKLAAFLKRICPDVLAELDKVQQSHAFSIGESNIEELEGEIKRLHILQPATFNVQNEMKTSCVAWSCTGSVIAYGLSYLEHDDWCRHSSHVIFYNINRQDFSASNPTRTVETSACVTHLTTHPQEPSIVAVGLFSGDVLIWNLQSDDDTLYDSSSHVSGGHEDAVTQVSWVPNPDPGHQGWLLVSSGKDGKIIIWQMGTGRGSLRLLERFAISLENSVSGSMARTPLDGGVDTALGVTCFSFTGKERSRFVVGVEGGGILDCTTLTSKPASVRSDQPLKDPVLTMFDGHRGSVTCLQCSCNEDMFISCGTDKELHIYSLNKTAPVQVIFTDAALVGVSWCPSSNQLLAAWGEAGISFYNQRNGEHLLAWQVTSDGKLPICSVHFNPHSLRLLAAGDVKGRVMIWQIPSVQM